MNGLTPKDTEKFRGGLMGAPKIFRIKTGG